ncbi:hypothetical protein SAPIO_CDS10540 [Scedosporium apiospermum]|uniref:Ricin B lectin domain-containing protein n=1 Tax=Pseudallescheria apiosperma TaxID=563466 RepID=A0A084FVM9_PSEDA|nr:uncharacterized protein SAPIO_CDS10540 [Scedosporium apiospermum]KEZ39141.1 hypothetical protein SAPIO_CDS10540 [Scedosporium apiospermum]
MFASTFLLVALVTLGLAQNDTDTSKIRRVYLTSNVNTKFVVTAGGTTAGSSLVVQTLSEKPEQQWLLQDGASTLQLADTTLCIDGGAQSNWKDMGTLSLAECEEGKEAQQWTVMEDGRIALTASNPQQCLDLVFMRAVENNAVGLYSCAGLGNTGAADKGINWPIVDVEAP